MTERCALFCPGYNAPYLSVYSENAVDVFDVNTMEWIQTVPLKKVSAADLHQWLHLVDVMSSVCSTVITATTLLSLPVI